MTLTEQREKLIELLDNAIEEQWMPDALLHAISAAGLSIVGAGVTENQIIDGYMDSGIDYQMSHDDIRLLFSAMLACADLARKPE
jgi:hypothetical protein